MATNGYEIELVRTIDQQPGSTGVGKPGGRWPNNYQLSEIATLTGLNKAEVWELLPENLRRGTGWRGRDYIRVAELAGFNTSPKFITFDKDVPWPSILRLRKTKEVLAEETKQMQADTGNPKAKAQDYWYTVLYNQGHTYEVQPAPNERAIKPLEDWLFDNDWARITSMMPFYLSDKLVLGASDF